MAVTRKIKKKNGEKRGYGCSEKGNTNEPQRNEYIFNKLSVVMKSQTVLPLKVLKKKVSLQQIIRCSKATFKSARL